MPDYPRDFPPAQPEPYSWEVDMGILRTPMDGGNARQRRLYDTMPQRWALTFVVPIAQLYDWQTWVNVHAYDYFDMPMVSSLSSQAGTRWSTHTMRFTSNLAIDYAPHRCVNVRVEAEIAPPSYVAPVDPLAAADQNWIPPAAP